MTIQTWVTQAIWEETSLRVMARMTDINNALILQASVASISYRAVANGDTEVVASTSLTVASVVFDTLQTTALDPAWTLDGTGYNFKYIFPPATFPTGGDTIYLPITFTDTSSPTAHVSLLGVKVPVNETYVDTPA